MVGKTRFEGRHWSLCYDCLQVITERATQYVTDDDEDGYAGNSEGNHACGDVILRDVSGSCYAEKNETYDASYAFRDEKQVSSRMVH